LVGANLTQFKLEPKVATVTIEASQSTMNTLNNSVPFSLYVDVSNVVSKQISLPILIKNLKYGVDIKTISPEEVEVTNLSF
jgi:YbbR domain-containing protein